jgi:type IV pilus assembly protein PilB
VSTGLDRAGSPETQAGQANIAPDGAVEQAIQKVPRDAFLPHEDRHLQLMVGRSMPAPSVTARMLKALDIHPGGRVLHVGTGSGYVAAVLSRLAGEVYTIERVASLVDLARNSFASLGYDNIHVRCGNGFLGWPDKAPFDVIIVSATSGEATSELKRELALGGQMLLIEGDRRAQQQLVKLVRTGADQFARVELGPVKFVSEVWDILVEMGVASHDLVTRARQVAERTGRRIDEVLRELASVSEPDIFRALAVRHGMKYGEVEELGQDLDPALFERVPRAFLQHNRLLPLSRKGNVIRVATCRPEVAASLLLQAFPGCRINLYLVTPTSFRRLWATLDLMMAGPPPPEKEPPPPPAEVLAGAQNEVEPHIIALFDAILLDAIGERASDIHLERYGDRVVIRLRVDGELRSIERFPLTVAELSGLINVIKVRANLNITEHRLPQGGRISFHSGADMYDLRIQTQPALHGEHVVIRLLPHGAKLLSIDEIGLPAEIATQYRRLLVDPAGLILVVGPTGSGKSTTLYAGLQVLAADRTRKVITIEDPIEYSIDGVQQVQVKPEVGFNFADAMRAFVREDPDVILVGEIRDAETALEAIRASQTGHLVLSTLHCNDAVEAVQRLFDLGMHPNSIAAELLAIIAQRLAARVCDGCRQEVQPNPAILAELRETPGTLRCWAGRGCARCGGRGTFGRVAVTEYLRVGAEMRRAISRQLPLDDLRHVALGSDLVTMRDSALAHVAAGTIPLSDLPRLLPAERMAPERVG